MLVFMNFQGANVLIFFVTFTDFFMQRFILVLLS
jgi:hypothetical protein